MPAREKAGSELVKDEDLHFGFGLEEHVRHLSGEIDGHSVLYLVP